MLVEVAASRIEICLQPAPELEGCWCLLRQISEVCALQQDLLLHSVGMQHILNTWLESPQTTLGTVRAQTQLRKVKKIKKENFF